MSLVILTGFSCKKKEYEISLKLPATPVLSVQSSWGIVNYPYLRVREQPFLDAAVIAPLRQNELVEVISRSERPEKIEDKTDYWYQVGVGGIRGWVFGVYLDLYETKEKAQNVIRGGTGK